MTDTTRPLSAGNLFSGMGGFATGFARAGFEIKWANDNDGAAGTAFSHRFSDASFIERDALELSVNQEGLQPVDVLIAGFPCQSFSQAGDKRGFSDSRGEAFFAIPRLLQEFAPKDRPRLVILENVPNLIYGGEQMWFNTVRRELRAAGYWFRDESCWNVNVKDVTDLPQDRQRLFMVGASREHFSYNPFSPPPQRNERETRRRPLNHFIDRTTRGAESEYLSPHNRYYKMIDEEMQRGDPTGNIFQLRRSYVRENKNGLCPTLTANMGNGGHNVPFVRDQWGIRRLSVQEVALLQGFEDVDGLFPAIPVPDQYRLLGNAVNASLAQIVATECARILTAEEE